MSAKTSKVGNLIYTLLTSAIILLGMLRDRFCNPKARTSFFRYDRTLPWCEDYGHDVTFLGCCDCGLAHLFICGHSVTPLRTLDYAYKLRFGVKAWADPRPDLVEEVDACARQKGVI